MKYKKPKAFLTFLAFLAAFMAGIIKIDANKLTEIALRATDHKHAAAISLAAAKLNLDAAYMAAASLGIFTLMAAIAFGSIGWPPNGR